MATSVVPTTDTLGEPNPIGEHMWHQMNERAPKMNASEPRYLNFSILSVWYVLMVQTGPGDGGDPSLGWFLPARGSL